MAGNIARFRDMGGDVSEDTLSLFRRLFRAQALSRQQFFLARNVLKLCEAGIADEPAMPPEALDWIFRAASVLRDEFVNWLEWDPKITQDLDRRTGAD